MPYGFAEMPAGILERDGALSAERVVRTGMSVGYKSWGWGHKRLEHVFHCRAGVRLH